ncbi:MAG: GGDEF domain-containing protein [Actinomycetota bacterium]|nr:GGDEF domain-containing protein [Actinomycetota bacterium]
MGSGTEKAAGRPASARFLRAAGALVEDAHDHGGGVTWVVTRADGDERIVLCAAGTERALEEGEHLPPTSEADLMLPLELPDGSVFGFLCALGAAREGHAGHHSRAQRMADVLSTVLAAEWEAHSALDRARDEARRADRAGEEGFVDPVTGSANRRAWDRAVEAEERRCRRYGGHASVIVVGLDDLDGLDEAHGAVGGDRMLRMVAGTLSDASRDSDTVARVADGEFALLALDCDEPHLRVVVSRLRHALDRQGVGVSVGGASRRPGVGLPAAWSEAEVLMSADRARRGG